MIIFREKSFSSNNTLLGRIVTKDIIPAIAEELHECYPQNGWVDVDVLLKCLEYEVVGHYTDHSIGDNNRNVVIKLKNNVDKPYPRPETDKWIWKAKINLETKNWELE